MSVRDIVARGCRGRPRSHPRYQIQQQQCREPLNLLELLATGALDEVEPRNWGEQSQEQEREPIPQEQDVENEFLFSTPPRSRQQEPPESPPKGPKPLWADIVEEEEEDEEEQQQEQLQQQQETSSEKQQQEQGREARVKNVPPRACLIGDLPFVTLASTPPTPPTPQPPRRSRRSKGGGGRTGKKGLAVVHEDEEEEEEWEARERRCQAWLEEPPQILTRKDAPAHRKVPKKKG